MMYQKNNVIFFKHTTSVFIGNKINKKKENLFLFSCKKCHKE